MSDDETDPVEEKPFAIEVAKIGRAQCKKCKQKCLQGELRICKLVPNPFGSGKMKAWHHVDCLFEQFHKQRQTTKRIESSDDIDGWDSINDDDRNSILEKIDNLNSAFHTKFGTKSPKKQTPSKAKSPKGEKGSAGKKDETSSASTSSTRSSSTSSENSKDRLFKQFRRLVADITNNSSYLDKTNCVNKLFQEGTDGSGFKDDIVLWCRLLLPGVVKRVYNLQSKQLIKLFSRIFLTDQNDMLEHLEQGDIGETIQKFFEESTKVRPAKNSQLTVKDVDNFLVYLSKLTKEEDQTDHFKKIIPKCTSNDLKTIIRLVKGDLRMGAGAKHILEGIHPDAYEAYQASRDIEAVIGKCLNEKDKGKKLNKTVKAEISVMTPVLPMLAEACKSVEQAMKKCPNGMYSEIKYDGERVQVHKHGSEFKYFSRNLKPVLSHKIQHFKEYIPQAFPHAKDLILDSEILMIDTKTSKPLPFGTLGVHKKAEFKDANVCLFVFDCIYYNGESLINKPISHRKKILHETMTEIPNRIVFSEMKEVRKPKELAEMIAKVLKLGLEGLVLKDFKSTYEPGKRHWLKVKKDYLFGGAMADTADLIVLGAWYGTGKKGGMMSVFLMGCYNPKSKKFCTVTKVHTGHDDKTLEQLQDQLDMVKISQDMSKVPPWLNCTKTMVPDFVAKDPKAQPVWEITGAEFTQHDVHTADGISIRFPRVTRIREDKDWQTATNLQELQKLYRTSKENTDVSLLLKQIDNEEDTSKNEDESSPKKKRKGSSDEDKSKNGEEPSPKKKKKDLMDYMKKEEKKAVKRERKGSPSREKKKKRLSEDGEKIMKPNNSEEKVETIVSESEPVKDPKDRSGGKTENGNIKEPLPEYFKGIKALVEPELNTAEHSNAIRHFLAHGGTVLKDDQWSDATHVFHHYSILPQPTIKCPITARHLGIEWVNDTVKEGIIQDFRCYTVKWDPVG